MRRLRSGAAIALLAVLAAGAVAVFAASPPALAASPPALGAGPSVQSITGWKRNASPVGWSANPDRVFYNAIGSDGLWNGYSANPDGSGAVCLTCTVPSFPATGTATNRGIADVSPDGRYMLVTVERATAAGEGALGTQPGKGGANDVYLYTTDGRQAWPLTDIYAPGPGFALGSIWPRFDRTGTKLVWSSMLAPPLLGGLGSWELRLADIVWSAGVPRLADVRTIESKPDSFYEPYGFAPGDRSILFATDAATGSLAADTIDLVGLDGSGLRRLSPRAPFPNYAEFAFYTPDGRTIIFGRGYDTHAGGMDYWTMGAGGGDPQRLTYLNEPWSTEYQGYSITGSLAFNPDDPNQFLAAVAHDQAAQRIDAVEVTLNSSSTSGRLTERIYRGQHFRHLVAITTGDPAEGFKAPGAPARGVPAGGYSISWTGGLSIPVTGTYRLCTVADAGNSLYLNGIEVLDARLAYGNRVCASAAELAGTLVPIRLDYWHRSGDGYMQLSWIPPGATAPQMIPSTDLSPGS